MSDYERGRADERAAVLKLAEHLRNCWEDTVLHFTPSEPGYQHYGGRVRAMEALVHDIKAGDHIPAKVEP